MKKLSLGPLFNRLGIWCFPLVSVSVLPFILTYGQFWDSSGDQGSKAPPLPPLSQLPSTSVPPVPLNVSSTLLQKPRPKLQDPQPSKLQNHEDLAPQKTADKPKKAPFTAKTSSKPSTVAPSRPKPLQKSISPAPPNYQPPPLEIRVAILRDEAVTTIGTSGQAIITDRNGKQLQVLSGNQGLSVQPNGTSLSLENASLPGVVWIQPTQGSLVYVGDRWYRGKILLVSQGNSLLAVNYVDLEHYLYSVVGSEMHANAPTEALKAQAIAARSYALVHMIRPASSWYDLGNTQRWQVYKGLKSEYNTGHHAVGETAGQILSHGGGVVESLYASTDDIVASAHGGRGMSQTGAYELAKQGYDYQQILDHYYPGVGLARLILN
ncbi:SpoIID/LytB domain-containing protein [Aphanothece sacrum]|uniref:Sporulation stage II protein D amidase enhancer LytB N-terminal domain-containing protein n=1 Tax=Aphanothece sacrum FPU1 TaxID=1920663 RepID=A0A401IF70_APHSA|nr:SpoIID/LytB domain-containing protein [Aphanothece sacrum]GBF79849.1 hypothetical protein AsFPU1_1249 [Aphanothece sacrum FPU1]GBF86349.1 hypothetical protein AsFPU3_3420 [Aphanothece sacrum FPU3]